MSNTLIVFLAANLHLVLSNTIALLGQPSTVYEGRVTALSALAPVSTTVTNITFTINGVSHREFSGLSIQPVVLGMRSVDLIVNNIPASLNGNSVGCTAELSTGAIVSCAPIITLQVQGTLGQVGNLNSEYSAVDRAFNVSWTAPPAITIPPATRPEIFYCVEINIGTATESIGCNRIGDMDEETSVIISDIVCGVNYNVIITPFNRVGDGVNSNVSFPGEPSIMESGTPILLNSGNLAYTYPTSGLVCNCMATILDVSVMGDLQCEPNATAGQITVTTNNVTTNRDFNIDILAYNSRGSYERTLKITRHGAFDLSVITAGVSELNYSVSFIPGTSCLGVFISITFIERGLINFAKSYYFIQNQARAAASNQLTQIAMGNYTCQVYNLESSGEITSENPADQEIAMVSGSAEPENMIPLLSFGISILCSSDVTEGMSAVSVTCQYSTLIYRGYRVYIQNVMDMSPTFVESTESGSAVNIGGTGAGEHLVFVFPVWQTNSRIPDGWLEPAHRVVYTLTEIVLPETSNYSYSSQASYSTGLSPSYSTGLTPSFNFTDNKLALSITAGLGFYLLS